MPNNTRIPLCPFYKDEKNKSISCEDTFRSFATVKKKYRWMDTYCDEWEWEKCPYAIELNEAYAQLEKGDEKALEKHEVDVLKRELKSMSMKLGRAEKRVYRQQKKIDELRAVNQSFLNEKDALERTKRRYFDRWKKADDQLNEYERKIDVQLKGIVMTYEQRMAYLIDTYCPNGKLRERDVEEWAKDRAFAIVFSRIEDEELGIEGEPAWKVVFQEDENTDEQSSSEEQED